MPSNNNDPQLIAGKDSNGNLVPIKVGSDGSLNTSGGIGGDANAANQQSEINTLTSILDKLSYLDYSSDNDWNLVTALNQLYTVIGSTNSSVANSDTANAPLNSLVKRLLQQISHSSSFNNSVPLTISISSTVINIPANTSRKGLTIYNPLAFDIFVGIQNTVSSSSFLVKLTQDFAYYEFPYGYIGDVYLVCASGNTGNIYVREFI